MISDFSNFNLISEVDVPQGREIARHGTLYMSKNHQMLGLRHLFIPLPFSCGKKCDFCHSDSMTGCFSCIGSTSSWNYDYLNMLNNIVKFVNEKGCSTIILKGGDPLLFFDKTKEILSIIRKTYSGSIILERQPFFEQIHSEQKFTF